MEDYEEYAKHARVYTNVYATEKKERAEKMEKLIISPNKTVILNNNHIENENKCISDHLKQKDKILQRNKIEEPFSLKPFSGYNTEGNKNEDVLTPLINNSIPNIIQPLKKPSPFLSQQQKTISRTKANEKKKWIKRI